MQTSYTNFPNPPRAGSLADLNEGIVVTRASASDIPFGRFVVLDQGSDGAADLLDNKAIPLVKLPGAATDVYNSDNFQKCEGIVVVTQSQQAQYGLDATATPSQYLAGQPMNVIRHGLVWVYVEEAVTPADNPYVRHTAGADSYAGTLAGNFNKGTDSSKSVSLGANARFMGSTSGAGLVQLMIRL